MSLNNNSKDSFTWGGLHPFTYHPFIFYFVPHLEDKTVLDCGCGKGVWGYLIRATRPLCKGQLIGIDVNNNYLDYCRKFNVYDKLIKKSITKLPVTNSSVDFLICSEVIEHMNKKQGNRFLDEVDRVIANNGRAIITTPAIHMETEIKSGRDAHHALWSVDDFKKRGYKVYGLGFRISPGYARWYTRIIYALGYVFTPISFVFPRIAGFLIAVKDY